MPGYEDSFHPTFYELLTGGKAPDPPAFPTVAMLPGRFVQRVYSQRDACREDSPSNPLELTCKACGQQDTCDVGQILMSPQKAEHGLKAVQFLGYVRCRHCGAPGPWDLPPELKWQGYSALLLSRFHIPSRLTEQIIAGDMHLFDGFRPRFSTEGEEHLLQLLQRSPKDAWIFTRLGNQYNHAGRPELAMAAFEHAVGLDPLQCEALGSIGMLLVPIDAEEAARYLRRAVAVAHQYKRIAAAKLRELIAIALYELFRLHLASDRQIPFLPSVDELLVEGAVSREWDRVRVEQASVRLDTGDVDSFLPLADLYVRPSRTPMQPPRPEGTMQPSGDTPIRVAKGPGRNDPCPCGSGLKYKRCCGRTG